VLGLGLDHVVLSIGSPSDRSKTSHYTTSDDNGFNGLFHNLKKHYLPLVPKVCCVHDLLTIHCVQNASKLVEIKFQTIDPLKTYIDKKTIF
jgi:hypothetical protein